MRSSRIETTVRGPRLLPRSNAPSSPAGARIEETPNPATGTMRKIPAAPDPDIAAWPRAAIAGKRDPSQAASCAARMAFLPEAGVLRASTVRSTMRPRARCAIGCRGQDIYAYLAAADTTRSGLLIPPEVGPDPRFDRPVQSRSLCRHRLRQRSSTSKDNRVAARRPQAIASFRSVQSCRAAKCASPARLRRRPASSSCSRRASTGTPASKA